MNCDIKSKGRLAVKSRKPTASKKINSPTVNKTERYDFYLNSFVRIL